MYLHINRQRKLKVENGTSNALLLNYNAADQIVLHITGENIENNKNTTNNSNNDSNNKNTIIIYYYC